MENRLQELTERLYREGVEKGEAAAAGIVAEAERRAAEVEAVALSEADRIVAEARRGAEALRGQVEAELRIAGRQVLRTIKKEIEEVIVAETLDRNLQGAMNDPARIAEFVRTAIENWRPEGAEIPSLELLLPEERRRELEEWFSGETGRALARGIEVQFHRNIRGGFQIASQEGGYRISLTDEAFGEFFKEFLRPRTRRLLFGEK